MKNLTYKQLMLYKYLEGCFKVNDKAFISKKQIAYQVGYKYIDTKDRNCVDMELDVRKINDNKTVPRIIVSNSEGYKIGNEKEVKEYLIKRYKRDFKSLNLTHKIEKKLHLTNIEINKMKKEVKNMSQEQENKIEKEIICECPICKGNIIEGKYGFYCESKDCKVSINYNAYNYVGVKKVNKKIAKELLSSGITKSEVKCHSIKKDKDFDAFLTWSYDTNEKYPNITKIKFKEDLDE